MRFAKVLIQFPKHKDQFGSVQVYIRASLTPVFTSKKRFFQIPQSHAGGRQEDVATTLEGLLEHCGGFKLPLRTETRAHPSEEVDNVIIKAWC